VNLVTVNVFHTFIPQFDNQYSVTPSYIIQVGKCSELGIASAVISHIWRSLSQICSLYKVAQITLHQLLRIFFFTQKFAARFYFNISV